MQNRGAGALVAAQAVPQVADHAVVQNCDDLRGAFEYRKACKKLTPKIRNPLANHVSWGGDSSSGGSCHL